MLLIEPSKRYYTCFFSNLYLGGFRKYSSIGHSYDVMTSKHGVGVIHDWAIGVDRNARTVQLSSGAKVSYDRLVVSPGIDLKYESVPGYSVEASARVPHAWKSGTQVQPPKVSGRKYAPGWNIRYGPASQSIPLSARTVRAYFNDRPSAETKEPKSQDHCSRSQREIFQSKACSKVVGISTIPAWLNGYLRQSVEVSNNSTSRR